MSRSEQRAQRVREDVWLPDASSADDRAPDLSNLGGCIEDVRRAALASDGGPPDPTDFDELRGRLEASRSKLPPLYREAIFQPYLRTLNTLGPTGFIKILLEDPVRQRTAGLMLDLAHAILQNGESYNEIQTDAFQEVVSDLYDGFLSAEDRRGIRPPDRGAIAPLVKWGNPRFGPYTWPVDSTATFEAKAAIVSLPPAHARQGLLAWSAIAHEAAGHDILRADTGLVRELTDAVRKSLRNANLNRQLPDYWADRIDETASDVLGILNMGPAAGIGLIGYFRGLNHAYGGLPKLRNEGLAMDPHPADILRGYLAAATVQLLRFDGAMPWSDAIRAEVDADVTVIRINTRPQDPGTVLSVEEAQRSAEAVARVLVTQRVQSLEGHSLGDIQDWNNEAERITRELRPLLNSVVELPDDIASGIFAAHVVAAGVVEALSHRAVVPLIFDRMVSVLKIMHDKNPSWGPLYVTHPGNIARHRMYVPQPSDWVVGSNMGRSARQALVARRPV